MTFVEESQADGHVTWTISRPERGNALGMTVAKELQSKVAALKKILASPSQSKKPAPLTLTITAQSVDRRSGLIWIAGGDLKELAQLESPEQARSYAVSLSGFCEDLEELPIPVIMLIDGAAIGGGAELALAGDIRIASKNSYFLFKQLDVGLVTGYGGTKRLVDLAGKSVAQRLLNLGERISANQAFDFGLLHVLCDSDGDLQDKHRVLCGRFAAIHPAVFAAQKRMLHTAPDLARKEAFRLELEGFVDLWMNPAHKKYLAKFK